MADSLPSSGFSPGLRNEGLTNRDLQEAERRKKLQNLKFQELIRTIEARTAQIQSPSNFVQQGVFNAFGNNVATQSLIQGAGLLNDLVFGPNVSPEDKKHDETKELLKKANETLSLMDESISTIQTITKIILDNILDSNKSLKRIVDISEESMKNAKQMMTENGEAKIKRLTFDDDSSDAQIVPFDEDRSEVLDRFETRKMALGYTPFTIDAESTSDNSAQERMLEGQRSLLDFTEAEKTSDISKQEKILEDERFRRQLLAAQQQQQQQGNALTLLDPKNQQEQGLGMLEAILGVGAISAIKELFSGAKSLIKGLIGSLKKVFGFIGGAGKGLFRLVGLINPIALKLAAIAAVVGGAMYLIKKYAPDASMKDLASAPGEFSGMEGMEVQGDPEVPFDREKFFDRPEPSGPSMFDRLFGSEENKMEALTPPNVLPEAEPSMELKGKSNQQMLNEFLGGVRPVNNTNSVVAMKEAAIRGEVDKLSPRTAQVMAPNQTNIVSNANVNNQTILPNRSFPKNNDSSFNRYLDGSMK